MAVAFSAVGAGNYGAAATLTWAQATQAGDYVLAFVNEAANPASYGAVTGVTCGGVAMKYLGSVYTGAITNYGQMSVWGLAGVAAGTPNVVATLAHACGAIGNSIAYSGVGYALSVPLLNWPRIPEAMSQAVTNIPGGVVVQSFTNYYNTTFTGISGGTNRYTGYGSPTYCGMSISDSTATGATTFAATGIWATVGGPAWTTTASRKCNTTTRLSGRAATLARAR